MYERLQSLDSLAIHLPSGVHIVNIVLACIMFGVALEIKVSDFKNLLLYPKPIFVGLTSQLFILPAITFGLVVAGHKLIPPGVAMGMILVAACPGGNMSNYMTALAKGNVALSVSLTSINTLLAVFMTPFNFKFWGWLYTSFISKHSQSLLQPLEMSIPHMLVTLCILLLIPLIVGMLFSHYFPKIKEKILKPIKIFSLFAFFVILVVALTGNLKTFVHHLFYLFLVVFVHNFLAILAGYFFSYLFKLKPVNRRTISIETGIQNSGLGLAFLLNSKIFPSGAMIGGMLGVTAWWGVWHIISGLFVSYFYRRKNEKSLEES